jgi:3-hydroxyisobutyrate dehydrogenase
MAKIGFIGLGNMGLPMAQNLVKAGHAVQGFDMSKAQIDALAASGGQAADSVKAAASGVDIIITMLPAGAHVREVYLGANGVLASAGAATLLIDSSTIDVETARAVAAAADKKGLAMLDAPVSGGVGGAQAGTLTFMVGGSDAAFGRALPVLEKMGKTIVYAGGAGNGQAAKICNNMILGVSMIAVSEAFVLAERLGLGHQALFDVAASSSGQCWALTSYCPVPGPVPASPANNGYRPGFAAALMLKDLSLGQEAAVAVGADTALGRHARDRAFVDMGGAGRDFSAIVEAVRAKDGTG